MRKLLMSAAVLMASLSLAAAQTSTPAPQPSWARVQSLPAGTALHVSTQSHSSNCTFQSATDDTLTCTGGAAPSVFQRTEIKSVKQRHRGRSTLAGLGAGAGVGAVIGAPLGRSGSFVGHGAAAAIFAIPLGLIGAVVGATTDFTHSTLYRTP